MAWSAPTVAVIVFAGAVLATAVGVAALRRRPDPMALPLAVLMFAVAGWAVPHAISLGFDTVAAVAFWHRLRYPGTVLAPVAYVVVAVRYAGYEGWLTRRTYAALGAIPVVTVALVWTNPLHGLFWRSLSIATVGGATVLVPEFGPWYWVNLGYLYLLTVGGVGLFAEVAIRSGTLYRKQAGVMLLGGLVPLATNVAIRFGTPGPTVDFTTTTLAVTGLTFALALFYLDMLEIRPVARERLVKELDDGVVVVGPDERIRDFNPTAARVLGDLSINQPAAEVLPADVSADGGELVAETDRGRRLFRTRSTPLYDGRGREAGRIVYLNDVTDLVEREQRISVLNRVLRHNVRNRLNVALGHLEPLEAAAPAEQEHAEKIRESVDRVVEFAEKARSVERTLRKGGTTVSVPAAPVVERAVAEARGRFPDATVEAAIEVDPEQAVAVVDEELFDLSVTELLENAVVHNDREQPQVTVGVEAADGRVRVTVADDGPGIPEAETAVLDARTETGLEHGSGLGLWLVEWTASLSGGDLSFETNEPRGSVVTLSLPTPAPSRED